MYADKKPDKVDQNEQRLSKWLNCALSNEPLKRPIVVDYLGNVFNKQALVEALLNKNLPKAFGYIKGLKDMISVELESIPELKERIRVIGSKREIDVKAAKVSGKIETNGKVVNGKNEAKRFKAADLAPANANKEVYASIFTSSRKSDLRRRIRADLCHLVGTDEVWFMWKVFVVWVFDVRFYLFLDDIIA
ncbi:putative replication termination factor 2 [Helianthus annuus]|nr:putative replication termination factor 2 [Helianthus annuus]